MQYFEQSNENMEVELQLIIVLLSFYNTRHLAYSRSWLQEEEDKRVDKPLKERVLGSMHNEKTLNYSVFIDTDITFRPT